MSTATTRARQLRVVAMAAAIAIWLDFFMRVLLPAFGAAHFPTSAYWVAPRLVLDGRGPLLYDEVGFPAAAEQLGAFRDGWISNPPFNVLPLLPLGALPEQLAYVLWTAASLAALVAAVALLIRMLRMPATAALVLVAALPLFHPLRVNFAVGQIYAFVLLLLVACGWALAKSGRGAAVAIAIAAIVKFYFGLVVLAVAVVQRRWRAASLAIGIVAVAAVAATALVGVDAWSAWLTYGAGMRSAPQTSVTAYQTLNSLFGHLFRFDPTWNPAPVANAPLLADVLWLVSAAAVAMATAVVVSARRAFASDGLLPIALAIPAALVVAPIAEDAHYLTVLLSLVVAGVELWRRAFRQRWAALAFAASIVLLAPAWPFNRPNVEGWTTLLFYPRVYGAILLWVVLLWLARRGPRSAEPARP